MAEPTSLVPLGREGTGAATVLQSAPFLQERAKMQMLERQNIAKQEAAMADAIAKKQKDEQDAADVAMKAAKLYEQGDAGLFQEPSNKIGSEFNTVAFQAIKQNRDNPKALGDIRLGIEKFSSDAKGANLFFKNTTQGLKDQAEFYNKNFHSVDPKDIVVSVNEDIKGANDFGTLVAKDYIGNFTKRIDEDLTKFRFGDKGNDLYNKMVGKTQIDQIGSDGKRISVTRDNVFSKGKDGLYEVKTTDLEGIIRTDELASKKYNQLVSSFKNNGLSDVKSRSDAVQRFFGDIPNISIMNNLETTAAKSGDTFMVATETPKQVTVGGRTWQMPSYPATDVKDNTFKGIIIPAKIKFNSLTPEGGEIEFIKGASIKNAQQVVVMKAKKAIDLGNGDVFAEGQIIPNDFAPRLKRSDVKVLPGFSIAPTEADRTTTTSVRRSGFLPTDETTTETTKEGSTQQINEAGEIFASETQLPSLAASFKKSSGSALYESRKNKMISSLQFQKTALSGLMQKGVQKPKQKPPTQPEGGLLDKEFNK
jgi:hypothetical protein